MGAGNRPSTQEERQGGPSTSLLRHQAGREAPAPMQGQGRQPGLRPPSPDRSQDSPSAASRGDKKTSLWGGCGEETCHHSGFGWEKKEKPLLRNHGGMRHV